MKVIYVAGPYSKGGEAENVHKALRAADELLAAGFAPLVPVLSLLWQVASPKPWETWMAIDLAFLERCDGLLRLPGESKGADQEVEYAKRQGIPVFYEVERARAWFS